MARFWTHLPDGRRFGFDLETPILTCAHCAAEQPEQDGHTHTYAVGKLTIRFWVGAPGKGAETISRDAAIRVWDEQPTEWRAGRPVMNPHDAEPEHLEAFARRLRG